MHFKELKMGGQFSSYIEFHNILKLFVLFSFVATDIVFCAKQRDVLAKTCTTEDTFRITFGQPFEKCIEECQRRRRCEFIMYKHGINECSLKDFVSVTALAEEDPVCLFAAKGDQEIVGIAPCNKSSCGLTETCVTSSNNPNRFECVKSECPRPPAVRNAKVLSNAHSIGQRNRYQCDKTYLGKGEPMITCKDDGTWTSTNFTCNRTEAIPGQDLGNAYLIDVVGEEGVEGTELHFACKPGYQGLGVYTSAVLTKEGRWSPPTIQCCNENITQFVTEKRCQTVFNGSTLGRFADIKIHCSSIGGSERVVSPELAEKVFDQEGYLWLWNAFKKSAIHSRLKDCFMRYHITDLLENFSFFTYKELVDEVISRNISGHSSCNTASWWAPNEPSGGEDENCIIFGRETFGMYDIKCREWDTIPELLHSGFLCDFILPTISSVINPV